MNPQEEIREAEKAIHLMGASVLQTCLGIFFAFYLIDGVCGEP